MSILLIDPDEELGIAIADLLVSEGDDVRVLSRLPGGWAGKSVYVATGDAMDTDLVERACTNVRTIVLTFSDKKSRASLLAAVVPAAQRAEVDRVVVCAPTPDETIIRLLDASGASYVMLVTGRRGFMPRKVADPQRIASAVSAADDLAGDPKLVVDLSSDEGWQQLGGHA